MGILPLANHVALVKDCYPLKLLTTVPISELKADSNSVSKLCFYAVGRPKKIPKVSAVIVERARINKSASGVKARATLAVTVDIMRGLVSECRSELRCFAMDALIVIEMALTRRHEGNRDIELEGRGASLFHAVATFASGPFLGLDRTLAEQYLRCLSLLSEMAQLGSAHPQSRWIALKALNGAVNSETLYGAASDYENQIGHIIPALLFNCLEIPLDYLHQESRILDSIASTSHLPILASRKSPVISLPSPHPSLSDLASRAIHSLRTIYRLSHGSQLTTKLSVMSLWFDQFKNGIIWDQVEFVEWIATSAVESSAIQYRAGVVTWWAEQVVEGMDGTNVSSRPITLLNTLSTILRGPTSLVGLGIGSILGQLTTLLIRRATLSEEDPITPLVLSAISALGAHIYYSDQMNDITSDLIETLRSVGAGRGEANALDEREKNKTMRLLIQALVGVMSEAKLTNRVERAVPIEKSKNGEASATSTTASTSNRPIMPAGNLTVRGNGVLTGSGQGLRTENEDITARNGILDGRPIMRISGSGRRHRISPEVFQQSLFLLSEASPLLRIEYEKALLMYVSGEMEVATSIGKEDSPAFDPSKDAALFLCELNASIFELATSTSITSSPNSLSRAPTTKISTTELPENRGSRKSSTSSRASKGKSNRLLPDLPLPADYAGLKSIIVALQSRGSALAVLTGVPMLLAIEKKAEVMVEEGDTKELRGRSFACRELVIIGLLSIATTWEMTDLKLIGDKALSELSPTVIINIPVSLDSTFTSRLETLPSPLPFTSIIESLATSQSLQAASGLDKSGLLATLSAYWSPEIARSSTPSGPVYRRRSGSRSVINLSTIRINSPELGSRSNFRASLADLQQSLGGRSRSGSSRTSLTPSLASTAATELLGVTFENRRRTSRASASNILLALNGSRLNVERV